MRELKALVSDANFETHLVLSASTRMSDLRDQAENFKIVGADPLLFTKLDETSAYGCIYSVAAETRLPISYLTMGQKVPEDIEPVDAAKLVEMVLRPMSQN